MSDFFASDVAIGMVILILVTSGIFLVTRNASRVFDPFEEAEKWFALNRLDLDSIRFSAYDEPHLVRAKDAVALVGSADLLDGEHVGFIVEVVEGRGVVEGAVLRPSGVATWHKSAAGEASQTGETLLEALQARARKKINIQDSGSKTDSPLPSESKNEGLIPGINAPLIMGGSPGPRFKCGDYMAVVTQNNQSVGPISYPFILVVVRKGSESPIMFVTAESNDMFSELVGMLDEDMRESLDDSAPTELFLGVFDKNGHDNLGPHDSISDLEGFTRVALDTMKSRLNLQEEVREA
ncbi:MAG: hypothetical protein KJP16_03510 [Gammaproteobacteria bacterium]|nr:hypothetical protein [Gammaproteobacteria bacterium]NNL49861.1 hypothetical protein [Woeseiaceae bacterium]